MRDRLIRYWHSTALLVGGLLLAGCSSNSPTTSQGAETMTAPTAPSAPAAPRPQGRRGKIRRTAAHLAAKDALSPCGLPNDKVYRLILTRNDNENEPPCPAAATDAEKSALGDVWAQQVLLKNAFPTSVAGIVTQMGTVSNLTIKSFVVGEGSQVPTSVVGADREANRNLRYVVTWTDPGGKAVLFLSAVPGGQSSFLQVIAWDANKNWFNFYEYNDDTLVWSWTGNSSYALQPETRGHGCFDCHHNGMVIMKELTAPWNNWHSDQAGIAADRVPTAVAGEVLFTQKGTADVLEGLVENHQSTFHTNRINGLMNQQQTQISGVPDLLRSIISQSTVNLVSSPNISSGSEDVAVPMDFFVRSALTAILTKDKFTILNTLPRATYNKFLTDHEYRLVQDDRSLYSVDGSTHFAFLVPVHSAEDVIVANHLKVITAVDEKFEASVMMVDFQNPVFSPVREKLQEYANQLSIGTWASAQAPVSDVPQRFAQLVEQAARNQPACNPQQLDACTAEQQFLYFWKQTDDAWRADALKRVQAYAASVGKRIVTPEGVNDYMRLAASRQAQMKSWKPIGNLVEFSLLFPQSDLPVRMHVDGTVGAN